MIRIVQLNVNYSGSAQDNLLNLMEEMDVGLAVISEPHRIPKEDNRWCYSMEDSPVSGIIWRRCEEKILPMQRLESGPGCFTKWNNIVVGSCYNSPNAPIRSFNTFLDALHLVIMGHGNSSILVLRDFNAHHVEWNRGATDVVDYLKVDWTILGFSY